MTNTIMAIDVGKKKIRLSTTTTGKRRDETPPGGKDESLLAHPKFLSPHPPFAIKDLGIADTCEPKIGPFPAAFSGCTFQSNTFLTFFS